MDKISNIYFSPSLPLPQKRLYENMRMGNLTKIYIIYKTAFWLNKGFSGDYVGTGGPTLIPGCDRGPVVIFYDATTAKGLPVLVGFSAGSNWDQWSTKSLKEIKEAVVCQVVRYFGVEGRDPVQFLVKDWTTEIHQSGCPANYLPPGAMHNYHYLRKCHGHIHFAATSTATSWTGYLSGAVQSGYMAAIDVLNEINASLLLPEDEEYLDGRNTEKTLTKQKVAFSKGIFETLRSPLLLLSLGMIFGYGFAKLRPKL